MQLVRYCHFGVTPVNYSDFELLRIIATAESYLCTCPMQLSSITATAESFPGITQILENL